MNKLTYASLMAISVTAFSGNVLAHAKNGFLVGGNGKPVSSSYEKCITVGSGKIFDQCLPEKPQAVVAPAPEPEVVAPAPAPAPEPIRVEKAISLSGDALFATNSAKLSVEGQAAMDKFVDDLKATENLQVSNIDVVGHADSRGNDSYNQKLSERRANTVGEYLVSKGVVESLVSTSGRGEADPVDSNATPEGRARNRRVDITLSGIQVTVEQSQYNIVAV